MMHPDYDECDCRDSSEHSKYLNFFQDHPEAVPLLGRPASSMVEEFHRVYGVPVAKYPTLISPERQKLRRNLIEEELQEFIDAAEAGEIVEVADALGDLIYVVIGAALEYGIPIDSVVTEIHRSNLSKLDENGKPIYRESDNKVLKGVNYFPPNLKEILDKC